MEKMKKYWPITVAVIAVIYVNIGVLVAYSLDGNVEQTPTTYLIRKSLNWWYAPPVVHFAWDPFTILLWPLLVCLLLFGNIMDTLFLTGAAIWTAAKWLFTGGLLEWLGIIKG